MCASTQHLRPLPTAGFAVTPSLCFQSSLTLGEEHRVLLFRSIRELIRNVTRHARAAQLGVTVRNLGHEMRVLVEDDGVGFVPELARGFGSDGGFGLFSIEENLEPYGGRLEIESAPGRGTRVLLVQPLPGSAHA